jgi:hypothetical protein
MLRVGSSGRQQGGHVACRVVRKAAGWSGFLKPAGWSGCL